MRLHHGVLCLALVACGDDNNKSHLVLSTSSLDFGAVDCGTAAAQQAVVIANTGYKPMSFTATLTGSHFSVTPAAGEVVGNGEVEVFVTPKQVPSDGGIAPLTDTLTITTDQAGDQPHAIPVTLTPHGAVITVSTSTVAFAGSAKVGVSAGQQPLTITNAGNADATVMVASLEESFVIDASTATVAAGSSVDRPVAFVPLGQGAIGGEIAISASGPQCMPIPKVTASGTGTFAGTAVDVLLVGAQQFRQNSATTCVLLVGGQVACLGSNTLNARGVGPNRTANFGIPQLVRTDTGAVLDNVAELAGQRAQVCARRKDGSVWCWGNIGGSQAKGATGQGYATPALASGATSISASYGIVCAVVGGNVECFGQRANRWNNVSTTAWQAPGTAVSLNGCGGYTLQSDGTVLAFGANTRGVRGNADSDNAPAAPVTGLANVVQIAGGPSRGSGGGGSCGGACALVNDGTVWCWGSGRHGKNGDGTANDRNAPVQVTLSDGSPLTGATKIAAGRHHRCAITSTGVYCWGRGDNGELGVAGASETTSHALPTDTTITNAVAMSLNGRATCIVLATGAIQCFGATVSTDAFAP